MAATPQKRPFLDLASGQLINFKFNYFSEAKAMAEKQMNDMKAQIEGKCVLQ
jgi:hypothetical protein